MLEHMATVDEKDLGIGLQFSCQVGQGRTITLTAGFPLDWSKEQMNKLLDKLADVTARQALKYELHDREAAIANMYHQVEVQAAQRARFHEELQRSWADRGKHGDFRLTSDQQTKVATYDTSIAGLQQAILKAEKELEDLRDKCL